ncbi:MAG: phage recombination protein Bet [Tepidibacillus sp.]
MGNLATQSQNQVGGYNLEKSAWDLVSQLSTEDKDVIKRTCLPPNANDAEFALYMYRCRSLGLDPFNKELVLQIYESEKNGRRITFITTRDGYLKVAERDPNYLGINSGVVREGDKFAFDAKEGSVDHSFGPKRGQIIGAWAIAYHKQRKPVVQFVDFNEYKMANRNSPIWNSMPSAMIQKVAEVASLRRQFPVTGLYTMEEMDYQNEDNQTPVLTRQEGKVINLPTKESMDEIINMDEGLDEPENQIVEDDRPIYTVLGAKASFSPKGNNPYMVLSLQNEQGIQANVYAIGEMLTTVENMNGLGEGSKVHATFEQQGKITLITSIEVIG